MSLQCLICALVLQDAHNCILEFDEETAMFAVYDGHGGNTTNTQDICIFPVFEIDGSTQINTSSLKPYSDNELHITTQ